MFSSVGPANDAAEKIQLYIRTPNTPLSTRLATVLADLAQAAFLEAQALGLPNRETYGKLRMSGPPPKSSISIQKTTMLPWKAPPDICTTIRSVSARTFNPVVIKSGYTTFDSARVDQWQWHIKPTEEELKEYPLQSLSFAQLFSNNSTEMTLLRTSHPTLYVRVMMSAIITSLGDVHHLHLSMMKIAEFIGPQISLFVHCSSLPDDGYATIIHQPFDLIQRTIPDFETLFDDIVCDPNLDTTTYMKRVGTLIYLLAHRSQFWNGNDVIINNLERAFYIARDLPPFWHTCAYTTALHCTLQDFLELQEDRLAIEVEQAQMCQEKSLPPPIPVWDEEAERYQGKPFLEKKERKQILTFIV